MPSRSVSFSEEGYLRIAGEKPEDKNFSEWLEELAIEGLNNKQESNSEEATTTENQ